MVKKQLVMLTRENEMETKTYSVPFRASLNSKCRLVRRYSFYVLSSETPSHHRRSPPLAAHCGTWPTELLSLTDMAALCWSSRYLQPSEANGDNEDRALIDLLVSVAPRS
jgi:hypothetical protein